MFDFEENNLGKQCQRMGCMLGNTDGLYRYPRDTKQAEVDTYIAAAAKSLQSCPTLCDPRDGSPPGSPIPGILQARILEWVAISFSNA